MLQIVNRISTTPLPPLPLRKRRHYDALLSINSSGWKKFGAQLQNLLCCSHLTPCDVVWMYRCLVFFIVLVVCSDIAASYNINVV